MGGGGGGLIERGGAKSSRDQSFHKSLKIMPPITNVVHIRVQYEFTKRNILLELV